MLTSFTTFIGLVPIMLETSMQAKMVIPMAVSLGFGVLFATVVTLVMIPSLYLIIEDMKNLRRRRKKQPQKEAAGVSNEPQIATKTVS